ncbi:hypothetical protein A2982_03350 [candidate division WWE3 bacterium RIFCSPLOWO2_01_FULL_39_13]|uniref:Uncharacterized protein n=1 Tax=candidate division WWE3 bacterium RIFCSPLOWO2_01_FULL_39_13 TaxID=1802624 RepID=A0A1F4V3C4_UNCKA|nr:MAG: hypothetical protein A2982_03350 [candidate division WWE3 bacterium RIFCSPLOWO2_01_FULL_39_13]
MLALRVLWLKSLDLTVGVFRSHYKGAVLYNLNLPTGLIFVLALAGSFAPDIDGLSDFYGELSAEKW